MGYFRHHSIIVTAWDKEWVEVFELEVENMMTENEFETDLQNEAVCPYCGHKHLDSLDFFGGTYFGDSTTFLCSSCEKEFYVEQIVKVAYTSSKLK